MKNNITKIILTVIALIIIGLTIWYMYSNGGSNEKGEITIVVIDETGTKIINEEISYDNRTTMYAILDDNYDIEVESGFLVRIENVEARNRQVAFIKIWINDIPSQKGVMQMKFNDGDIISFVYTEIG